MSRLLGRNQQHRRFCGAVLVFALFCLSFSGIYAESYTVEKVKEADITVYIPPEIHADRQYPVLYLFHGKWQQPEIWEEIGLSEALNELYAAGEIIPFFVVLPHDQNYMVDLYDDDFYKEFLEEVMPYVENHYPVSDERDLTALGGVSRGALWVQYFAFDQYGRFGHIGVHSPPNPFFSFPKLYRIIQDHPEIPPISVRIDIGSADNGMRIGQDFSEQLTELFYPHEFVLGTGGHDVDYWRANIKNYLRWYSDRFEKCR